MSETQHWKETLQPFAVPYAQLVNDIEARTQAMSDDELRTWARAIDAGQPSSWNCWWATYQVARLVREAIRTEQYRRQLGGERVADATEATP